jgi:GT2 family glycosyltransferase
MPPETIVTVAIVTYHTDFLVLKSALDTLRASLLPIDIVIVDNSQNPDYFAKLKAMAGVRCIESPRNGGYGFGHNFALSHSERAPYHLIINPDVELHPGCLETLVAHLDAHPEIGLAVPKVFYPNGDLQPLNKTDPSVLDLCLRRFLPHSLQMLAPIKRRMDRYIMADHDANTSYDVPFASGCFMLFRRHILDQIGGFDERFFMYFEDADISRRTRALARVTYFPDAHITHRWARGAYTDRSLMRAMIKSAGQYFTKWGWRWW